MRVLVIGNLSDVRCGFQNFSAQTLTALTRAGHAVVAFDGTYSAVYARHQDAATHPFAFFPPDVASFDVIHIIWNALTLNHYNGADWAGLAMRPDGGPIISWWDGGPSDASCPFLEWMQVRWSDYPRPGYHYLDYPVPDWLDPLTFPPPAPSFTVGASSIRGDGMALIEDICTRQQWAMNLPTPGAWVPLEDEIRRLARSTVNVCWYHTPPLWHNRASAPSMLLAARRPIVINTDPLVAHLWARPDIYHGEDTAQGLEQTLLAIAHRPEARRLTPRVTADAFSWTRATNVMTHVWRAARADR